MDAPAARISHTAVWSGNEMIVWGGSDINTFLNTGGRYNPSTDSWTPQPARPMRRPRAITPPQSGVAVK